MIRVLDNAIVGKIAAGEVVERPSSVAKELIENSIDAGSTAITVEIRNGGIDYLRVTDNGCGIPASQVLLAFTNHATSKISKEDDLNNILTLGFRGEALPSIAAVSKVELTSREKGSEAGVKFRIEGGTASPVSSAGCPEGTTIIVKDIFYNVPVRRTFLKKPNYEASLISELVSRMILGNPKVSFRFINNGKTVYHSYGDGDLKHAIFAVYGAQTAENMKAVNGYCGSIGLSGMIGIGELAKTTRAHQSFFINGRSIRCAALSQALEMACKTRVTIGTYPMCALSVTMPSNAVDINVHPNKLEVRFRDEQSLLLAVETILNNAFDGERMLSHESPAPKIANSFEIERTTAAETKDEFPAVKDFSYMPQLKSTAEQLESNTANALREDTSFLEKYLSTADTSGPAEKAEKASAPKNDVFVPAYKPEQTEMPIKPEKENKKEFSYRLIGTLFNTYLLLEVEDSLMMIDQHAAHERIIYERINKRVRDGETLTQNLLIPIIVSLSASEMAVVENNLQTLESTGYDIEVYGERSIMLRGVPFVLGSPNAKLDFIDLLQYAPNGKRFTADECHAEIALMACKAAVKGGDKLSNSEINALIESMLENEVSPTCPHGRPVYKLLRQRDIEKMFKRIQ